MLGSHSQSHVQRFEHLIALFLSEAHLAAAKNPSYADSCKEKIDGGESRDLRKQKATAMRGNAVIILIVSVTGLIGLASASPSCKCAAPVSGEHQ